MMLALILFLSISLVLSLKSLPFRKTSISLQLLKDKEQLLTTSSSSPSTITTTISTSSIVIIAGFESFNKQLYINAANEAKEKIPDVSIKIFTDIDIDNNTNDVDNALKNANVLLCSLIFDYNQVQFIKDRIAKYNIPVRFCFESALELMSETKVGEFTMGSDGQSSGPPPAIKALLSQFGSKKEEDKMVGYINFLKIGPKLLQYVPGEKAKDIRNWLTVYSYWNQGSIKNIVSMFCQISDTFQLAKETIIIDEVIDNPPLGMYHPQLETHMDSPKEYVDWYEHNNAWITPDTPRVGMLLYRKHVLSNQQYLKNLIKIMETEKILPIPVYINGVEGHTVVRDLFTSDFELNSKIRNDWSLSAKSTKVDFIINTIGFPLVGGPAGSMEGGRKIELASEILKAKNVPYVIAAPLIIQDIESWEKSGVQGLQQVVLYSLPELDGAIETQVLGGIVGGDSIIVIPERVRKLTARIKSWSNLRKTKNIDKKITILVYGFPPNVGAVGTAALLNVGASLRNLLLKLSKEGYSVGSEAFIRSFDQGDKLINALRILSQDYINVGSIEKAKEAIKSSGLSDFDVIMEDIDFRTLKSWLGKSMTSKIEKNWGDLESYSGISSSGTGKLRVSFLRIGNVLVSIQPILGIEGDPMRALFERDLTPHPQYAAFYQWLQNGAYKPDAVVHFGMHGTFEWLPGSSLGSTAESWPEIMIGSIPNLYIYAVNNPSESLLAKRRGFATLISHNIPSYSRSGLYNELTAIRELILDYRTESSNPTTKIESVYDTITAIISTLDRAGLYQDIGTEELSAYVRNHDGVASIDHINTILKQSDEIVASFLEAFSLYVTRVSKYLMEIENRLFSDGLHIIGEEMNEDQIVGYLDAVLENTESSESEKIDHDTLKLIATRSIEEKGEQKTSILLQARKQSEFKIRFPASPVREDDNEAADIFANILTEEDKFSLSILKSSISDFFQFRYLLFQRDFLYEDVNEKINDFIAQHWKYHQGIKSSFSVAKDAVDLAQALVKNPEIEMNSIVHALAGDYIAAGPGGDLLRDGINILPTGRNMYSLDPYRIPSVVALKRGREAAEAILILHRSKNDGQFPETVAITLWGLDIIKTKGESLGIVLSMVGATPVREGTGRIVDFELIPLEKLGRPRIDVLCSLSGIFRDSFANVIDLLDALFEKASNADEPVSMNFIKKHSDSITNDKIDRSSSRLFSNPNGEFGSMVNEKIGSGDWSDEGELGATWEARNSFSYGKKGEKGVSRPELLRKLLNTTDRIIQEIDSVEYGLTDIQEYYANTGAIKKAITNGNKNKKVGISIVEAFDKKIQPKEVEEVLRLEYRSKLLNPTWSNGMLKQGAGGAYEISGRITGVLGWAATINFSDQYIYNSIVDKYVLDDNMADKLKTLNPEAFRNILKRSLELSGRGYWKASDETLQKLNELYADVEDEIEGVN